MRTFACRGWCQRVFIDTAGLPAHALVRAAARQLCPLCDGTVPLGFQPRSFVCPDAEPVAPPAYLASAHPRLHKKLNARRTTIRIEDTGDTPDLVAEDSGGDEEYHDDASDYEEDTDASSSASEEASEEPHPKHRKIVHEQEEESDEESPPATCPSMLSKLCLVLVNFYYAHPACLMQEPYTKPLCYICGTFAPQAAFCRSCKMRLRVNARQQLRQ